VDVNESRMPLPYVGVWAQVVPPSSMRWETFQLVETEKLSDSRELLIRTVSMLTKLI
jgi:hypothetical protein